MSTTFDVALSDQRKYLAVLTQMAHETLDAREVLTVAILKDGSPLIVSAPTCKPTCTAPVVCRAKLYDSIGDLLHVESELLEEASSTPDDGKVFES